LGKKAQDLVIKKGFPNNIFKLTTETKTSSGIKIITETTSNQKSEILGAVKPEYALDNNFKFKGELNTNHLSKVQVTGSDLGLVGSQVDVSLTHVHDTSKPLSTEFEGKGILKQERFALSLGGIYQIEKRSPKYKGQLVVNYPDHVYWSTVGEYSNYTDADEKVQYDLTVDGKLSYIQPNYEALANVLYKKKEKTTTFTGTWYQEVGKVNYGVIGSYKQDGNGTHQESSLNVAAENKCADGLVLKGRVSTTLKPKSHPTIRTAVSLAQKVSSGFTFTVGADLNVRHLFPGLDSDNSDAPHSFGFEVKLND